MLKSELKNKGVKVETLVIFFMGGEIIVGDLMLGNYNNLHVNQEVRIYNPKRIIRSMFRSKDGSQMGESFGMTDFALFTDESSIIVSPTAFAKVDDQPNGTQESYLGLYLQHLETKAINSAIQAGLSVPQSSIITG